MLEASRAQTKAMPLSSFKYEYIFIGALAHTLWFCLSHCRKASVQVSKSEPQNQVSYPFQDINIDLIGQSLWATSAAP